MKQIVLTTPSEQEILVVEVPNNTYACEIYEENLIVKRGFEFYQQWDDHNLPQGNWQGKRLEEYQEEEIQDFVKRRSIYSGLVVLKYLDFSKPMGYRFDTAKESFHSFLRSKGIDTQNNPFIAINRE